MKKLILAVVAALSLAACSEVGTFKPMGVNPAVGGVVFGMATCAIASGLCVIP